MPVICPQMTQYFTPNLFTLYSSDTNLHSVYSNDTIYLCVWQSRNREMERTKKDHERENEERVTVSKNEQTKSK